LLDAEPMLNQVQHKVQHDIFSLLPSYDTASWRRRGDLVAPMPV
jgi:hypothetical protein